MSVIELEELNAELRAKMLKAFTEPVLVTQGDKPVLVIRNLLEDDAADELIAQHPGFQETNRRARRQKASGQVRRLAELRKKYDTDEETD